MFIIVWRGWGILVPVFVIVAFFAVVAVVDALAPIGSPLRNLEMPLTGLIAGNVFSTTLGQSVVASGNDASFTNLRNGGSAYDHRGTVASGRREAHRSGCRG